MKGVEEWDEDRVNGIDVDALSDVIRDVGKDPRKGLAEFRVKTVWQGRARSETTIESCSIGGKTVPRKFSITADEPTELLGENSAANPQELLMAALNSCLMVSYVASAAIKGIELESIEIETEGELDLRGFLGIDRNVPAGYETIRYTVHIKGDGTPQEFREVHDSVMEISPNFFNLSRSINLVPTLVVD
jgi:uncharacterized OsmC-like protein